MAGIEQRVDMVETTITDIDKHIANLLKLTEQTSLGIDDLLKQGNEMKATVAQATTAVVDKAAAAADKAAATVAANLGDHGSLPTTYVPAPVPVLVEPSSTPTLQPFVVPKPKPLTPTKCSMECLDDDTSQVMPTLLRDLSFPAILLPPMRKENEQQKWLPPTHMKVAEDNGERPMPWPSFVGCPCQELVLMPSSFFINCHSGVHQKQLWPPPQGIYLELSIGHSTEVYWCSVVQQADDHGDRCAIITCQKDKGLLLANPQDALFLEGPKPEPEIDVSAAPVANHLNIGSSESRTVHSEAQNNGGEFARSIGGESAYTPKGLVRAELIDECIAVNHFPEKHKEGAEERPMPWPSFVCDCQGMISMQPQQTPQALLPALYPPWRPLDRETHLHGWLIVPGIQWEIAWPSCMLPLLALPMLSSGARCLLAWIAPAYNATQHIKVCYKTMVSWNPNVCSNTDDIQWSSPSVQCLYSPFGFR